MAGSASSIIPSVEPLSWNPTIELSDENTKTDLPYVNNFLMENKLLPFTDICDLLENEKVKSDKRVFDYWKLRCDFQTLRNNIMDNYEIDSDSLNVLVVDAVSDKNSE